MHTTNQNQVGREITHAQGSKSECFLFSGKVPSSHRSRIIYINRWGKAFFSSLSHIWRSFGGGVCAVMEAGLVLVPPLPGRHLEKPHMT